MHDLHFWGSATVGSKGQVVIPSKARAKLDIKEGDQLIFFSPSGKPALAAIKADSFEYFLQKIQTNIGETITNFNKASKKDANK